MRIGIDARILQGEHRGQWRYARCLIDALLRVDTENTYVLFYHGFRRGEFAFPPRENLEQYWCGLPGRLLKPLWAACGRPFVDSLIPGKIDLFHNLINYTRVFHTPLASRCPMVATYHGIASPQVLEESFGYSPEEIRCWMARLAKADRVICISELVRRNLGEYLRFPESRLRVVYSGVEERFRVIDPAEARRVIARLGLENRFLLYVGGMERNKNLESLLGAFARLQPEQSDLRLALAGKVSEARKGQLAGICPKGVTFLGEISDEELIGLYNTAAALVLPTIYEGFGLTVLEAMACGCPVIASRSTGVLEKARDAVLQFDPYRPEELLACLRRLTQEAGLAGTLRARGLQRVKDFSWEETARQTIGVYRELA